MDFGTILLIIAVVIGLVDITVMMIGPRLSGYESISLGMSIIAGLSAIGALLWMAGLIFGNQFQYEYVWQTTSSSSDTMLKISALWAGASGSLLFWTMLSFVLYLGFRITARGYEDDTIVYRAAIIMAVESVLIAINAILADPFRMIEGLGPSEGLGLNPLLRTFWNAIHPPIVFIAYALIMVPFAIKLAGFTVRTDDRNQDKIPIIESISNLMTVLAWVMLSLGIVIGGYWAYIVLGWGGYWAWDPVETTSLIPWLLLTGYYHAKALFRKNDVLRDSFLVFAFLTVLFATWVTRSGVLNSVHGFQISIISWTMLATLLGNFIVATIVTLWSGYRDIEDDDEDSTTSEEGSNESPQRKGLLETIVGPSLRRFSIKLALLGIIIVTTSSTIGVLLPAVLNIGVVLANPSAPMEEMVSVGLEFFKAGFYFSTIFLLTSAFYCMDTSLITNKVKGILVAILVGIGGILGILSLLDTNLTLPTNYWPANILIPIAVGAVAYIVIVFVRTMAGKEKGVFTMRKMGRVMLHMGMVILILGVFMSENVTYESNDMYLQDDVKMIGPGIYLMVEDINLLYFHDQTNFKMVVTVIVIEGDIAVGIGFAVIEGHPEWGSVSHSVYLQSNAVRDVFVAITGFSQPLPNTLAVTLHAKVLPFVSFVWIGSFFMIAAMLPMIGIELRNLRKTESGSEDESDEPQNLEIREEQ
ncbi:MAG: cytochrome c biogenesis protein CcsA [Candidatus Thorarchaeota archaeon]